MTERGMERERHTMKRKCIFFTLVELIIVIVNKWIKKCKCVYKNMLNVVIVVLWLLTLSYNLNANEIEMKLVKTIESNPTYMSFDEMEKSLILMIQSQQM